MIAWWPLCLGIALSAALTAGLERIKVRPPLVEDEGRRKLQKQTHCHFGNQSYELEERWRPDLGPPFGTLYCMRCECIPVQRKKRVLSRVRCKDIKSDCPRPTCENPVLLPQRCCKSCPGEDYADLEEDIAIRKLESEDDDKMLKEFTALLTGKTMVPPVFISGAAQSHFVFSKRDLHYTIQYSRLQRPTFVRFTSEEGNILEEHEVSSAGQHAQDSKICGVWRRVPKVYRRQLQKDKLLLVLVTPGHSEGVVGGRIMKHEPINTESYGALLVPDSGESQLGVGATARIFPLTDSIHVALSFNGIFTSKDGRDSSVVVTLSEEDADGRIQKISHTQVTLAKAHPDYNSATVKLDIPPGLLEKLSSRKLELRLSSMDGFRHQSGRIQPSATCSVFQAVLRSAQPVESGFDPVTGFIIFNISPEGLINYRMQLTADGQATIQLETDVETPNGMDMRVLQRVSQNVTDSYCNGSFDRRASQEVEMMLTDDLVVRVFLEPISNALIPFSPDATSSRLLIASNDTQGVELRGDVRQRLYTEAFLNDGMPRQLVGGNGTAGGAAWLSIDAECALHYQLEVAGLEPGERHLLELLQAHPRKHFSHPFQRILKKFDGDQAEDVVEDLDGQNFAFLDNGYSYLVVTSKLSGKAKTTQLRTRITGLFVPPQCHPRYDARSLQRAGGSGLGFQSSEHNNDVYGGGRHDLLLLHQCIYEDELYEDGSSWKAEHEDCTMCSCQRGKVKCERTICPEANCDSPISIAGDCCPFCPGNSSSEARASNRYCFFDQGDRKYHAAGSRWHPYVPPFGFSKCSLCTCEPKSLTVKCERITCPPLPCPDKDSFRENSNSCCKKCKTSITLKSEVIVSPSGGAGHLGDQGGDRQTPREILANGGCKFRGQVYPNGDEWHPTIQPYGIEKCVKCHCKDGRAKCRRKKCSKESCAVKIHSEDGCCDQCANSGESSKSSESSGKGKKKRKEREKRNRKPKDKLE